MAILSTPFDLKVLQKLYPNSGKDTPKDIVKYEITLYCSLMVGIAVVGYLFIAIGKFLFGIISYNITYDIRKKLYETILVKNIGYFDHPENSTFVLSGVMQNDTTIINGVATDSIPPLVEAATLLSLAFIVSFYICW
jgi:ATP-binding cassette subfamily B (MDR/TAP) protein 1